jgi:hypothetical protein
MFVERDPLGVRSWGGCADAGHRLHSYLELTGAGLRAIELFSRFDGSIVRRVGSECDRRRVHEPIPHSGLPLADSLDPRGVEQRDDARCPRDFIPARFS